MRTYFDIQLRSCDCFITIYAESFVILDGACFKRVWFENNEGYAATIPFDDIVSITKFEPSGSSVCVYSCDELI